MALTRIRQYWKTKIELFGDNAFHPLSAHDLSAQDIGCLQLGGLIVLPGKDKAGRALLFIDRSKWAMNPSAAHRTSFARAYWFTIHQALQDVETQKKGFVMLAGTSQKYTFAHFDRKISNIMIRSTWYSLPMRIPAVHCIAHSRIFEMVMPFILWAMGKEARRKLITHFGSHDVTITQLASDFGIMAECVPCEFGGKLEFDYDSWLAGSLLAQGIVLPPGI